MLSSRDITNLIATPPTRFSAGSLAYMQQRERNASDGSVNQTRFLEDIARVHDVRALPAQETYAHPDRGPDLRRGDGPLTETEMRWLERLPSDPAKVSADDATAVAGIATAVNPMKYPTDARLAGSYWKPILDHHDTAATRVVIRNANAQPLPPIPSSTLNALGEAVARENPNLRPDEALTRAGKLIEQASQQRQGAKADRVEAAQRTINRIAAEPAMRSRLLS